MSVEKANAIEEEILEIARERFGFVELRPGQADAIEQVVSGRDTLAVFPTGSGKSAIYQIAGLTIPGATVVISPLIALQRDQVEALNEIEAGEADEVNSHRTERQREKIFSRLANGELEFIFLAPEQLANQETIDRLMEARPSLFVVDEAHCISEWGHDFRPDYARLGEIVDLLGHPITLALTATASPPVREEIVERLHMRDPFVAVRGFDRPNIFLEVRRFRTEQEKREELIELVANAPRPGIVYTATRHDAEAIAQLLIQQGVAASAYHAGLSGSARDEVQTRFMADELEVIVATIAFGMGIDKPNVRFVIHYSISESLDTYYQEIGRSGRDGQSARATLLYHPEDLNLRRFQAASGRLEADEARRVLEMLVRARRAKTVEVIEKATGLSAAHVERALMRLEDVGAVKLGTDGATMVAGVKDLDEAARMAAALQERHRRVARTRLEMMRQYADTAGCRRAFVLGYFGQPFDPPCGRCDNCVSGRSAEAMPDNIPFPISTMVVHKIWGEGEVVRYEGDTMTVLFHDAGYRTLSIELVAQEGLLRPSEA
jgi:ATP-dependent DNA helicase RecQ